MAVEAAGMTDQQIEHFYSEGYVVVPDVFDPERDFDPPNRRLQRTARPDRR